MSDDRGRPHVAIVTGASSGIGAATAIALALAGFRVILGARRLDALEEVAARCDGTALALDVTQTSSVDAFAGAIDNVDVLVNNAGLAVGRDPVRPFVEPTVHPPVARILKPLPGAETVECVHGLITEYEGLPVAIADGERVPVGHPLVKKFPDRFRLNP